MDKSMMTRGERRGILALLILLALIVGGMSLRKCGHELPSAIQPDTIFMPLEDTLKNIPDTSSFIDKASRKSRKKRAPKPVKQIPERSPLDEII